MKNWIVIILSLINSLGYLYHFDLVYFSIIEATLLLFNKNRFLIFIFFTLHYTIPKYFYGSNVYENFILDQRIIFSYFLFSALGSFLISQYDFKLVKNLNPKINFFWPITFLILSFFELQAFSFILKSIVLFLWLRHFFSISTHSQFKTFFFILISLITLFNLGLSKQLILTLSILPIYRIIVSKKVIPTLLSISSVAFFLVFDFFKKRQISFSLDNTIEFSSLIIDYLLIGRFNLIEPTKRLFENFNSSQYILSEYMFDNTIFPNLIVGLIPSSLRPDINPGLLFQKFIYGIKSNDTYVSLGLFGEAILNSPNYYFIVICFELLILYFTWFMISKTANKNIFQFIFIVRLLMFGIEGYFVERWLIFVKSILVMMIFNNLLRFKIKNAPA